MMPEQTSEKAEVKMYSDFKSLPQRYYPDEVSGMHSLNSTHVHGTSVLVEEPSTASGPGQPALAVKKEN
jgi:hypothetical protein